MLNELLDSLYINPNFTSGWTLVHCLSYFLFTESMELTEFSFGKKTPFVKYVKVFENIDENDSTDIPATEGNAFKPPVDMATRQRHLLVLVMDLCLHAPDTKIAINVRLGGKM